jgi:lysophospholipase L1-like esterase
MNTSLARCLSIGIVWIAVSWCSAAAAETLKIMPLGDSITLGVPVDGGYRLPLYNKLTAAGYQIQFVGTDTGYSGGMPAGQKNHEGHSGFVISTGAGRTGLAENLNSWMGPSGAKPDVILLMIGTNDVDLNYDLPNAPNRLGSLITSITTLQPNAKLIVAQIVPIKDAAKDGWVQEYNRGIAAVVAQHKANHENVSLVDMHAALDVSKDLADGLHPNASGYEKMADVWLAGIKAASPVPEPASMALLVTGACGAGVVAAVALARRRFKRTPRPYCLLHRQ